jgi:hypothetical protein
MDTPLRLVHSTDHTENFMSRVFTEEFASRLEAVNRVARELRAMGYHTASEIIGEGSDRPTIEINPGAQRSTEPLVALGRGKLMEMQPDGSRIVSISHEGVRVVWREVSRAKAEAV